MSVDLDEFVKKTVIAEGNRDLPIKGQEVVFEYDLKDSEGRLLESTKETKVPFVSVLGCNELVQGLEIGLLSMRVGETAEIVVEYQKGYGELGLAPLVSPKSRLIYTVTLLEASERQKSQWEMTDDEIIELAKQLKLKATADFKEKHFEKAASVFKEGVDLLSRLPSIRKDTVNPLKSALLVNLANTHLKLQNYSACLSAAEEAGKIRTNPKAFYFVGQCCLAQGRFEEAETNFLKMRDILPEEGKSAAEDCLRQVKAAVNSVKKKEKSMFKSIFSQISSKSRLSSEIDPNNPKVLLELSLNRSENLMNFEFELFKDKCPKTVENWLRLAKTCEVEGKQRSYVGSKFFRLVKNSFLVGGDVVTNDGSVNFDSWGAKFADENLDIEVDRKGLLVMANEGKDTNGSMFFLTLGECNWLTGKHCVFGRCIKGLEKLEDLNTLETDVKDRLNTDLTVVNIKVL